MKNIDIQLSFNVHFFDIENIELKSMSMLVQTLILDGYRVISVPKLNWTDIEEVG